MANANNAVVLRPHPFSQDHGVIAVRPGQTIAQMLDEATEGAEIALTVRVEVGGREVPRAWWGKVTPKPGVALHVTRMPAGSSDGDGNKWLRTILMIVVAVVAIWVTGGGAAGLVGSMGLTASQAAMGVMMIGALRLPAFIPESSE